MDASARDRTIDTGHSYRVEEQIGFLLRRAHQRATSIFTQHFQQYALSTVQFTALVKLRDEGRISQNRLGRLTYMDPATIMGVIKRLATRGLIRRYPDPNDRRLTLLGITSTGLKLVEDCEQAAHQVTAETLDPLDEQERQTFLALLTKLT